MDGVTLEDRVRVELLTELLWDELRQQCCISKLDAKQIIDLQRHDLHKVITKIHKLLPSP